MPLKSGLIRDSSPPLLIATGTSKYLETCFGAVGVGRGAREERNGRNRGRHVELATLPAAIEVAARQGPPSPLPVTGGSRWGLDMALPPSPDKPSPAAGTPLPARSAKVIRPCYILTFFRTDWEKRATHSPHTNRQGNDSCGRFCHEGVRILTLSRLWRRFAFHLSVRCISYNSQGLHPRAPETHQEEGASSRLQF